MNNVKKILIASLIILNTSTIMAMDTDMTNNKGVYVGAGIGFSEANNFCDEIDNMLDSKCDDTNDNPAWNVFAGYRLSRYFAAEAGYSDLGSYDGRTPDMRVKYDADAFDLSLLGILPLGNRFSVYARGGYSVVDADTTVRVFDGGARLRDGGDEGAWVYGAGIGGHVTDKFELRADWRRYNNVDNNTHSGLASVVNNVDIDVYSLEALYHFGTASKPVPAAAPVAAPEQASLNILVLFDFDKSVVKPEYEGEIQKAADYLNAHPEATAVIEGHTDSVGTDAYNQALSERRANAVMNSLINKHGISANRLSRVGYGESKPVATNETAEGRQQNRRVVAEFEGVSIKVN